ncbi:uncharacterized protein LOC133302072 [Gastrolobium bilobum]|uniref:uncharacterized protein LOC133302072 n=1 Tax=Gastrolobium bilobum TaxID=150636 RepID=UPI002AAFE057|nr:uncharacterized protein LOC133302072 [Gastrolobium bilobum]
MCGRVIFLFASLLGFDDLFMVEKGGRPPTTDGDRSITRESKKAKGLVLVDQEMLEGSPIVGAMETEAGEGGSHPETDGMEMMGEAARRDPRGLISYKDKLIQVNGVWDGAQGNEDEDWLAQCRRDEEEEKEAMKAYEQTGEDDPLNPYFQFDVLEKLEQCKRWRNALIGKLMGKRLGAKFLWNRIHRLWNLEGEYKVLDLENDHYLVEFEKTQDYLFIQQQGPWIVADHYLIVQRWRPNFDPHDEKVRKLAVWIRIPGVPREFYTFKDLWRMRNMVGRTLRIDESSLRTGGLGSHEEVTDRGRFARICVEVNLSKSLLSKFRIGQRQLYIGYGGLHLICFLCGQYGHRKDVCSLNPVINKQVEVNTGENPHGAQPEHCHGESPIAGEVAKSQEEDRFGTWMTVQRRNNKRAAASPKNKEQSGGKGNTRGAHDGQGQKNKGSGSRFESLGEEGAKETRRTNAKVVAESGQSRRNSDARRRKGGLEKNSPIQVPVNAVLTPEKQLYSPSTSGDHSKGLSLQSPVREAILVSRANSKWKSQEVVSMPKKDLFVGPGGSVQVQVDPGPEVNPSPELSRAAVDESGRGKAMHSEGRVAMALDDITNVDGERRPHVAGKKGFSSLIKDLVYQNKIQVLALLETRISGKRADSIVRKLGFDDSFRREAEGFSGGIWLLWNKNTTTISILEENHQFVHSKLTWLGAGKEEYFTFVYGSPQRIERRTLWDNLKRLNSVGVDKWAVMGDFNVLLEEGEKQGGSGFCAGNADEFSSCLSDCSLLDVGFSGPKFTWKRGGLQERIDRLVVNEAWHLEFPNRSIMHLLFNGSDHRPILIRDDSSADIARGQKPFRFLAAWLTDERFGGVVKDCWQNNSAWVPAKTKFQQEASLWHQNCFKRDQRKKYHLQRRLKGIEEQLCRGPSETLDRLHREIWQDLNSIFIQEELTWFQRSRCNWLAFGDRNSRFFHSATVARTRRNKVTALEK